MQPLPGFEEIPTQQFWNRIIDAWWQSVWKRKNPWYHEWRSLRTSADHNEHRLISATSIHCPLTNRHSTPRLVPEQEVECSNGNICIRQFGQASSAPIELMAPTGDLHGTSSMQSQTSYPNE